MAFLIGTDEAGYGPNLGPLVIGGTRWSVPELDFDVDQALCHAICREKSGRAKSNTESLPRLLMADSKEVYKAGKIKELELGVLSMFAAVHGKSPANLHELMQSVCGPTQISRTAQQCQEFWLNNSPISLPVVASKESIDDQANRLRKTFAANEVLLDRMFARIVFPERFNDQIQLVGNKATLLSGETLSLVRELIDDEDKESELLIRCDKHGGRNAYASLLQHHVTDEPVRIETESKLISRYSWNETAIEFICKGESHLPVALSSMIAKYLRELLMMAWNHFWQIKIPDLKATKGYPQDAKRFKKDIEETQRKLKIPDHRIWRNR